MVRLFILLLFFMLSFQVDAQSFPLDIKETIKNLSTKRDPRSIHFNSVANSIRILDSVKQCEALSELEVQGPQHSGRYKLQVLRLKCYLALNNTSCSNWPPVEDMLKTGWQLSNENDDPTLIAEMNKLILSYYANHLDYGSVGLFGVITREMEMNAKAKNALIRYLILLIILLAASTGYLLLHRQRLKLQWRQQQIIQEIQKAERDAQLAIHKLAVFTDHLVEKTNLVEKLEDQLLGYQITPNAENADPDLTRIVLLTDEDWEQFKVLFEHVHPGFFSKLKDIASDITIAEQRMAALIKLKIPGRKAASILAISPNSAYKSRQRLRHRLGLESDEELDAFFSGDGLSPR